MSTEIVKITNNVIKQIYNGGSLNKGLLSNLRNSTSINDRYATKLWPLIFSEVQNDKILSNTGKPTPGEIAIYTSLRCYAIMQQGTEEQVFGIINVDENVQSLFSALSQLNKQMNKNDESARTSLDKRVDATLAMANAASVINSILHLVRILHSQNNVENIKINFGQLANDLYFFQMSRSQARKVALRWGQNYYFAYNKNLKGDKNE